MPTERTTRKVRTKLDMYFFTQSNSTKWSVCCFPKRL